MANFMDNFNDSSAESTFDGADIEKNKVVAVIPYLIPILFFLPIISDKDSDFCKFHANQQLIWFICCAIIGIITKILSYIPILGILINAVIGLALLAFSILLMASASQGKAVRIPFVGNLFEIF